jgi:hypothetical protein
MSIEIYGTFVTMNKAKQRIGDLIQANDKE